MPHRPSLKELGRQLFLIPLALLRCIYIRTSGWEPAQHADLNSRCIRTDKLVIRAATQSSIGSQMLCLRDEAACKVFQHRTKQSFRLHADFDRKGHVVSILFRVEVGYA